jgi:hypothetical protein
MLDTLPNDIERSGRMLVYPVQFDIVDFLTGAIRGNGALGVREARLEVGVARLHR